MLILKSPFSFEADESCHSPHRRAWRRAALPMASRPPPALPECGHSDCGHAGRLNSTPSLCRNPEQGCAGRAVTTFQVNLVSYGERLWCDVEHLFLGRFFGLRPRYPGRLPIHSLFFARWGRRCPWAIVVAEWRAVGSRSRLAVMLASPGPRCGRLGREGDSTGISCE